jgi:hypothetical protein
MRSEYGVDFSSGKPMFVRQSGCLLIADAAIVLVVALALAFV